MRELAPPLPVVFLPGAAGHKRNLEPIAARLAPRRQTVLCAYPGLGDEPADPELHSLSDLQRHLLASLPDRFDLVAMSMGGVLALRIALEAKERVRKLVLLATSGGVDVLGLGGLNWRDAVRTSRPELPRWFLEDRTDLTHRLGAVDQPTLLVFGDADLIAPVAVAELLRRHLPNATLEVIAGATHDLELQHPDLISALIEAHLRRR
jgi:poly(3-hydroxyoctanoate) depolymerase